MREKKRKDDGGMVGVSSRADEITHFDGIKMSVFPSPICGEIARNRAVRTMEEGRRISVSSSFSRTTLVQGK